MSTVSTTPMFCMFPPLKAWITFDWVSNWWELWEYMLSWKWGESCTMKPCFAQPRGKSSPKLSNETWKCFLGSFPSLGLHTVHRLCEVFTFPSEQRVFLKWYSVAGNYVAINVTRGVAKTYIVYVHFNFRPIFHVMKEDEGIHWLFWRRLVKHTEFDKLR